MATTGRVGGQQMENNQWMCYYNITRFKKLLCCQGHWLRSQLVVCTTTATLTHCKVTVNSPPDKDNNWWMCYTIREVTQ